MINQGWIRDYRKEIDSDIWVMPPLYFKVWQYLKYMANHKNNTIPMTNGSKELIERGQHLTSLRTIAKGVSYYENRVYKEPNPKTIKKILEWLEKNNMIILEHGSGNKQFTKITLVNYSIYQVDDNKQVTEKKQQRNSKETAEKHESNDKETLEKQSVDINNNDKNDIRMNDNEKEWEEGEECKEKSPSLPPLSFPTQTHKKFYEQWGENSYRTWFMDAIVIEGEIIKISVSQNFKKEILISNYKEHLEILIGKKVEIGY